MHCAYDSDLERTSLRVERNPAALPANSVVHGRGSLCVEHHAFPERNAILALHGGFHARVLAWVH